MCLRKCQSSSSVPQSCHSLFFSPCSSSSCPLCHLCLFNLVLLVLSLSSGVSARGKLKHPNTLDTSRPSYLVIWARARTHTHKHSIRHAQLDITSSVLCFSYHVILMCACVCVCAQSSKQFTRPRTRKRARTLARSDHKVCCLQQFQSALIIESGEMLDSKDHKHLERLMIMSTNNDNSNTTSSTSRSSSPFGRCGHSSLVMEHHQHQHLQQHHVPRISILSARQVQCICLGVLLLFAVVAKAAGRFF